MKRPCMMMALIAALGAVAHADFTPGSQTAAIFGGFGGSNTQYSYQPGTDRPVSGGGAAFGAQYLYYVRNSPAIAVGFDLASSMNGTRTDDDLLAGGYDTDARVKSTIGLFIAKLAYPRGLFRPYLFGGLGFHSSSQLLTATPHAGVTWPNAPANGTRVLVDEHTGGLSLGLGIGFDLFLTETLFAGMELRGSWLQGLDTDDNAAVRNAGYTARDTNGVTQGNIFFRTGVKF
jgi:hypothetical protein